MSPNPLNILYQDDWLLAVNKPSGLAVHRGWAKDPVTLVDLVRERLSCDVTYPINRLDRGASGLVLFAMSPDIASTLQAQMHLSPDAARKAATEARKTYLVLVRGVPPPEGVVDHPIPATEGDASVARVDAVTRYRTLASVDATPRSVSLVQATLLTGRLHQIRRHMKHLGHPVLGDSNYGRPDLNRHFRESVGLSRLALHAARLRLDHPETGDMLDLTAPLPADLWHPMASLGFSDACLGPYPREI